MPPAKLVHYHHPLEALSALCAGFEQAEAFPAACELVEAGQMPPAYRGLLAHDGHMTAKLNALHDTSVALRVHRHLEEDGRYRRFITLVPSGTDHVVEVGVVRLNLGVLSEEVRERIVERRTPLGDIFTQHDVMTRVDPHWFFRFRAGAMSESFERALSADVYGRVATIHLNGEPALELLEVVSDELLSGKGE